MTLKHKIIGAFCLLSTLALIEGSPFDLTSVWRLTSPPLLSPPIQGTPTWTLRLGDSVIGWVRVSDSIEGALLYESQVRFEASAPPSEWRLQLSPLSSTPLSPLSSKWRGRGADLSRGYRLLWRHRVGDQDARGRVEVSPIEPTEPSSRSIIDRLRWQVTFYGEGVQQTHVLPQLTAYPLVEGLWGWMLSGPERHAQYDARPLIYPLSGEISSISLYPLTKARQPLPSLLMTSPTRVRFQTAGSDGVFCWRPPSWISSESTLFNPLSFNPLQPLESSGGEVGGWTLNVGETEARWTADWSPWPGILIDARLKRALHSVSVAPLIGTLPWRRARWVSLDVQAPIAPLSSTRQLVSREGSDHFNLRVHRGRLSIDPADPADLLKRPPRAALDEVIGYPTSHPEIQALLRGLNLSSTLNDRAIVERIFQWISKNMRSTPRRGVPRVLEAIDARAGDCNEQSAIFVTLCRAAGVSAEQIFGLVPIEGGMGYHAWAQVWLDGHWVEVDPLWNQRVVDAGHVAFSAGDASAQGALRALLGRARFRVLAWGQ